MLGFAFNLIFTRAQSNETTLALINASPTVPSLVLFIIAMFFCPESPRFHLIKGPNYDVQKAYTCMKRIRNTEVCHSLVFLQMNLVKLTRWQLQALRDIYLVYKSLEQQAMGLGDMDPHAFRSPGFMWVMRDFLRQYMQLFQQRRLYNALISTSTVNLAQQLCGSKSNKRFPLMRQALTKFQSMFWRFIQVNHEWCRQTWLQADGN